MDEETEAGGEKTSAHNLTGSERRSVANPELAQPQVWYHPLPFRGDSIIAFPDSWPGLGLGQPEALSAGAGEGPCPYLPRLSALPHPPGAANTDVQLAFSLFQSQLSCRPELPAKLHILGENCRQAG